MIKKAANPNRTNFLQKPSGSCSVEKILDIKVKLKTAKDAWLKQNKELTIRASARVDKFYRTNKYKAYYEVDLLMIDYNNEWSKD